jgi:hypothetical protein
MALTLTEAKAMTRFPIPSSAKQYEYLLRVYFGNESDQLGRCIQRAYRDLQRTIHGVADVLEGEHLRARASAVVRSFLTDVASVGERGLDQTSFDCRHRAVCAKLCLTYRRAGFARFRVGQAQKWLNMALKYVFVFGEDRLPGYKSTFKLAHIPLDNIILGSLRRFGVPRLGTAWARISRYEDYMSIQRWVRSAFPGSAPLAVEFALWQNSENESVASLSE